MQLKRLFLKDFRNYERLDLTFDQTVHVLYGPNASGKTNVLEAIYFVATASSHRTSRNQELIRNGASSFFIKAKVYRHSRPMTLEFVYDGQGRRGFRLNGTGQQSLSELYGRFNAVFFSPEDLQLVKGAPSMRRSFLDFQLGQVSPTYQRTLTDYRQALMQRNNLLKELRSRGSNDSDLLEVWDEQLVTYGAELIVRRVKALQELVTFLASEHAILAGPPDALEVEYDCSILPDPVVLTSKLDGSTLEPRLAEAFSHELMAGRPEELHRGYTLCGPHRDDIVFRIDGADARSYASQGQQRTIVLALKLASVGWMERLVGETPVLLLDDVLSELDPVRRQRLLARTLDGTQTFITCTDLSDVQAELPAEAAVYHVEAGHATPEQPGGES